MAARQTGLLLLDNFEQVVEAAPLVAQLLQAAPGVKALVASRMSLGLRGTQEYPILPMSLPDRKRLPPLARVAGYEGIRLFVARAAALKPDFALDGTNAEAIVEICHRLDGLRLAIELAAARVKVLPPRAMLARLQSRPQLSSSRDRDVPARQQTLRNTIEWSYDLLDGGEKQLFRRVAVFQGRATLEAIDAVCTPLSTGVLDGVESLVSKNLMLQQEDSIGEARFWMLETIHEYAEQKLAEADKGERKEAERLQQEHALYFMKLAEEAEPHLTGAGQQEWRGRLEEEHDNIRAALLWSRERATEKKPAEASGASETLEVGLRIAGAIWRFWLARGHLAEGREQLEWLLALTASLATGGTHAEALSLAAPRGKALNGAGTLAYSVGDYATARSLYEEGLRMRQELGDKANIAYSLFSLGNVAYLRGEHSEARTLYQQSLAVRRELGDKVGIAQSLAGLGGVAVGTRQRERGARLLGASSALMEAIGANFELEGRMAYEQGLAAARSRLGEEAFEKAWAEGRAMSMEWAAAYAFGETPEAPAQRRRAARLTLTPSGRRERVGPDPLVTWLYLETKPSTSMWGLQVQSPLPSLRVEPPG